MQVKKAITKVGMGFDVHACGEGGHVMLGGYSVPHTQGLVGHSDADVLLHALVDAILGALALDDIGEHFSPNDPQWEGADSSAFVKFAVEKMKEHKATLIHLDATVLGEAPKISPHRLAIRERMAALLGVELVQISLKATTTEALGFLGRKEGLAAQVVVTLEQEV